LARNRDCQAANYAKRGLITARRPADLRVCPRPAETLSRRAEQVDLRTLHLGDMARPFHCHA
jgi:hypothetical protein